MTFPGAAASSEAVSRRSTVWWANPFICAAHAAARPEPRRPPPPPSGPRPGRVLLRRLLRARRLLDLGPSLRRPDLDPLHRARPGDFLDQADVIAQTGRDEDPAQLVDRAFLGGRDEGAREQADVAIEHRFRGDLLRQLLPGRGSESDETGIDQVRRDDELVRALGSEQLAKAPGEAGTPLGVDGVLEDAGKHRARSLSSQWHSTSCHFDPLAQTRPGPAACQATSA